VAWFPQFAPAMTREPFYTPTESAIQGVRRARLVLFGSAGTIQRGPGMLILNKLCRRAQLKGDRFREFLKSTPLNSFCCRASFTWNAPECRVCDSPMGSVPLGAHNSTIYPEARQ
jgi:hypothetical protein